MAANSGEMWEIASKRFVVRYCPREVIYVQPCCKAMSMFLESAGVGISPSNWKLGSGTGSLAGELGLAAPAGGETVVPVVVAIITAVFSELAQSTPPLTQQVVATATRKYASQFQARSYLIEQLCESLPDLWFHLCRPSGAPAAQVSFVLEFSPKTVIVKANSKKIRQFSKQARWEFLEFLLMRFGQPVHWLWGFVIFSAWRNKGRVENPQGTLRTRRTRLQTTLQEVHPSLKVEIENLQKSPFWSLIEANFESNVTKAMRLCTEAEDALSNNDESMAFEKTTQALQLHETNENALRIKASAFVRSEFKGIKTEEVKKMFRKVSQAAINYGGAVETIKALDQSLKPLDKETADIIEQNSQELNEYAEAFERFLDFKGQLPKDYIECKKFVSLAYDFHRHKDVREKQDNILYQINQLPFVHEVRQKTARAFKQDESNAEQAFQSAFGKIILQKKLWPMNNTKGLVKYFTKTLYAREHHRPSTFMQPELSAEKERFVRQYLEARKKLTEENEGLYPLEQELREYLGWDEARYWEIHDLVQAMFRYEDPGQRFEEDD